MRCERARERLLAGANAEFEAHLRSCAACFDWLEADALTGSLRAARPGRAEAPAGLADRVLAAWLPVPRTAGGRRPGLSVALIAAALGAWLVIAAGLLSRTGAPLWGLAGSLWSPLSDPVASLAGDLRGLLLANPVWAGGLALVAVFAAWAWTRLDLRLSP